MNRRILPFRFEGSQGRWAIFNVGLMLLLSESCGQLFRFAERTCCSDVDVNRDVKSNGNGQSLFGRCHGWWLTTMEMMEIQVVVALQWAMWCKIGRKLSVAWVDWCQQRERKASSCCCIATGDMMQNRKEGRDVSQNRRTSIAVVESYGRAQRRRWCAIRK